MFKKLSRNKKAVELITAKEAVYLVLGVILVLILLKVGGYFYSAFIVANCEDGTNLNSFYRLVEEVKAVSIGGGRENYFSNVPAYITTDKCDVYGFNKDTRGFLARQDIIWINKPNECLDFSCLCLCPTPNLGEKLDCKAVRCESFNEIEFFKGDYIEEQVLLFGGETYNLKLAKKENVIYVYTEKSKTGEKILEGVEKEIEQEETELIKKDVAKNVVGYDNYIKEASETNGVDEALIVAVITQESRGRVDAISDAGAVGLVQLMPETAREMGLYVPEYRYVYVGGRRVLECNRNSPEKCDKLTDERFKARENILAGTRYLKMQLDEFKDIRLALAAYNCGPGCVKERCKDKFELCKLPSETNLYVKNVMAYYGTGSETILAKEQVSGLFG